MYNEEQLDDLAHKLWAKSEEVGECILWNGGKSGQMGYGVTWFNGKQVYIHRLIYHIHNPDAILDVVRHTCDVPNCWNIDHLINGTTADNVQDKMDKMRHLFGSKCYNAKFTDQDIKDIRASELNLYQLAKQYNVTASNIYYIRVRKTWTHVL